MDNSNKVLHLIILVSFAQTENSERDFAPDTGTLTLYRHSAGKGVRMDGIGYSGLKITPFFDSMIVKYTASGATFEETVRRMKRVLQECRIRGVKTNVSSTIFLGACALSLNPHLRKNNLLTHAFPFEKRSPFC